MENVVQLIKGLAKHLKMLKDSENIARQIISLLLFLLLCATLWTLELIFFCGQKGFEKKRD
jgi:hypothetical protein